MDSGSYFENYEDRGLVENPELLEASGLVYSKTNPGYLWTFNNGNYPNKIYLIDQYGKGIQDFTLQGATNRDWEAMGSFNNSDGTTTLFVADIGDNLARYPTYNLYWFKEPTIDLKSPSTNNMVSKIAKINFTLSDGSMRDMECILIDQLTKDVFLISKRENEKYLYKISAEKLVDGNIVKADFIKKINFSIPLIAVNEIQTYYYVTDGAVSPDNSEILVRNYGDIYYWKRKVGESIPETLDRPYRIVPSRSKYSSPDGKGEPQGEGVSFSYNADGYFTISERVDVLIPEHLFYFKRQ